MVLKYRFTKEKLDDGSFVSRPKIPIEIRGSNGVLPFIVLLDTGCDTTVIPEGIARELGLNMEGKETEIVGYKEKRPVIQSKTTITFLGKEQRRSIIVPNIPILIDLNKEETDEGEDIVLGIDGIFDVFEILFKKSENKITLKKASKSFLNLR